MQTYLTGEFFFWHRLFICFDARNVKAWFTEDRINVGWSLSTSHMEGARVDTTEFLSQGVRAPRFDHLDGNDQQTQPRSLASYLTVGFLGGAS